MCENVHRLLGIRGVAAVPSYSFLLFARHNDKRSSQWQHTRLQLQIQGRGCYWFQNIPLKQERFSLSASEQAQPQQLIAKDIMKKKWPTQIT